MKNCTACEKEIAESKSFCGYCGAEQSVKVTGSSKKKVFVVASAALATLTLATVLVISLTSPSRNVPTDLESVAQGLVVVPTPSLESVDELETGSIEGTLPGDCPFENLVSVYNGNLEFPSGRYDFESGIDCSMYDEALGRDANLYLSYTVLQNGVWESEQDSWQGTPVKLGLGETAAFKFEEFGTNDHGMKQLMINYHGIMVRVSDFFSTEELGIILSGIPVN